MIITDFLIGALAVCSMLLLWFGSPLKISLGKFFFKKEFIVNSEFDDFLFMKSPILGKLLSCWICLSFWLSLIVGVVFVLGFNASIVTPLITFLVYPSLCYIFKAITKL